jgi:Holliday junction resolvase RusA-like endonuclease
MAIAKKNIKGHVVGTPFSRNKVRGNIEGLSKWSSLVVEQTQNLEKIYGPCKLCVTFRLPPSKRPKDHPFGNDLDNLLKRFCDALGKTILSEAPGKDGAIIDMEAKKIFVLSDKESGALFEIMELEIKNDLTIV